MKINRCRNAYSVMQAVESVLDPQGTVTVIINNEEVYTNDEEYPWLRAMKKERVSEEREGVCLAATIWAGAMQCGDKRARRLATTALEKAVANYEKEEPAVTNQQAPRESE